MSDTPVEISIDELALHGFDPSAGQAMADGLQAGLAAALTGWQPAGAQHGRDLLDAGTVATHPGATGAQVGRAIGGRVARALHDTDDHDDEDLDDLPDEDTGAGASR